MDDMFAEREVAIVTNAAQGLGFSIARKLAARGINVLLVDTKEELGKAAAIGVSNDYKVDAQFFRGDMTKEEDVKAMVQEAIHRWGRLDWAANNFRIPDIPDLSNNKALEEITSLYQRATWLCQNHEAQQMLKQEPRIREVLDQDLGDVLERGSIVNVISGCGGATTDIPDLYSPTKVAALSISASGGMLYGRYGIRCNSVSPGSMFNPEDGKLKKLVEFDQSVADKALDLSNRRLLKRSHRCEGRANVVSFLLSGESSVVNGVNVPCA